jgi:hypothetical protein
MASRNPAHDLEPPAEAQRVAAALAAHAAASEPRAIDDQLLSDFMTAVNALPWASMRRAHAELIESFVWLGWLRRDGDFTGLSEEGARVYAAGARHD